VLGRIAPDDPVTPVRPRRWKLIHDRGHQLPGVVTAHGDDVAPSGRQIGEHREVVVELVRRSRGLLHQRGADRAAGQIQEHPAATQFDHPR
jgi:hypothetical protein